jgi:hypothetical protein
MGLMFNSTYPLPITHYPLPLTHYPLPITHYPLPITHYPLPITHYLLPITVVLIKQTWITLRAVHTKYCVADNRDRDLESHPANLQPIDKSPPWLPPLW